MRDGNDNSFPNSSYVQFVVSLPMRDGNILLRLYLPIWRWVVSLPMRDGNVSDSSCARAI